MGGRQILRNVTHTFLAKLVSLLVSLCMVMLVPKFLSVSDYGLWQLFLFYFSYLGFLHFGWADGIYLRYAGRAFSELSPSLFAGQFYALTGMQILLATLGSAACFLLVESPEKRLALMGALCLAPLVNFNTLCSFILQITNRIRDFAWQLLAERLALLALVSLLVLTGLGSYGNIWWAKVVSLLATVGLGAWFCRSLLHPSLPPWGDIWQEAGVNLRVGIKLMFANIASMLIIGIVRYGISLGWDVETFGRISLTLAISNFFMVFISSVSVVFFPILKRLGEERAKEIYLRIRLALSVVLLGALLSYYPLKTALSWWLPQYADSLIYMSVIFPVCLFESKVDILTNTYLKSLRQEALMLKLNLAALGFSVVLTAFLVGWLHDLESTILAIPVLYAFRSALCELAVGRLLDLPLKGRVVEDLLLAAVFTATGWCLDSWLCTGLYGLAYGAYVLANRQKIVQVAGILRGRQEKSEPQK